MAEFLNGAGAFVLAMVALGLVRVVRGPTDTDRMMAAQLLGTGGITALLLVFLGTLFWTGRGFDIERDVLIAFDVLLVVVIGLLLYSASARDPRAPPDAFDALQVALLLSALLVDAVALWAIASRITELGFTPNRVAALGENVILLVNLLWSAVLYVRFLRGRGSFSTLEPRPTPKNSPRPNAISECDS